MNAQRAPQTQALGEREAQEKLERMIAAHHARVAAREAKLRRLPTPRSQIQADAKAPPRTNSLRITRRDVAVFFLPVGLAAAMALLAHWTGCLR